MSTGENIKRIRKFRGMTQKELGIAIGIGEESASPRMAQYETDNRTPRKEMLHKMAAVLDVDPRNISIPTGYREEDMIYRLLVLEDYFPEMKLERNGRTGEVVINLQNKKINEFLYQWGTIRGKKKQGMISEDEYMQWKYCRNHDFACTNAKDMYYEVLADRVHYFKEDEKGGAVMCKAMEDMRNEAAKMKAVHIARLMLDGGKLSYEDIAAYTELTIEEVEKIASEKKSA